MTTRLKLVVLFSGFPVTVMGKIPVGVDALEVIVSVLEHVGLHGLLPKLAVAPAGRPEVTLRLTACVVPNAKFRVIVFCPADP